MMATSPRSKALLLICLHVLLGIYALSDVFSKAAADTTFASWQFVALYVSILACLGAYAIGWQQIIKRMALSKAYSNRAITIVWGMFWGAVLFGEPVTLGKVLGAAIIIAGIVLFVRADATSEKDGMP